MKRCIINKWKYIRLLCINEGYSMMRYLCSRLGKKKSVGGGGLKVLVFVFNEFVEEIKELMRKWLCENEGNKDEYM